MVAELYLNMAYIWGCALLNQEGLSVESQKGLSAWQINL